MISLSLATAPYHALTYLDAAAGGGCIRKELPFVRGQVRGLPPGAPALVAMADLQGRTSTGHALETLVGCAVAADLPAIHTAAGLPAPRDCIGLPAGDFYTVPYASRRGGTGDVTAVWQHMAGYFRSRVGVQGNHDLLSAPPPPECLEGGWVDVARLRIAGVPGIIAQPTRDNRHRADEFGALLATVNAGGPHVLVLHPSPSIDTTHRGDDVVRQTLEHLDYSGLVITGHLHWPQRIQTVGRATVLNVHDAVVTLEMV